jgi:hypothetical protein
MRNLHISISSERNILDSNSSRVGPGACSRHVAGPAAVAGSSRRRVAADAGRRPLRHMNLNVTVRVRVIYGGRDLSSARPARAGAIRGGEQPLSHRDESSKSRHWHCDVISHLQTKPLQYCMQYCTIRTILQLLLQYDNMTISCSVLSPILYRVKQY